MPQVIQPKEMSRKQKANAIKCASEMYCLLRRLQAEDGSLSSSLNLPIHLDAMIEKLVAQIDEREPVYQDWFETS